MKKIIVYLIFIVLIFTFSISQISGDDSVRKTEFYKDVTLFGDGSDGDVIISSNTNLNRNVNYHNLTVENDVLLDTQGYVINVSGLLENHGIITDTNSGGNGGSGGLGGDGGGYISNPTPGECGTIGGNPLHSQAGYGGNGGGSGGGGGGAWFSSEYVANGGNGGSGGLGGDGGGYVQINAFFLDNTYGVIHADGTNGQAGENGGNGEYVEFDLNTKDLAGGGGGGGSGGDGGDGGTVEIYYAQLVDIGEIHANPGIAGILGYGGNGQYCSHTTIFGNRDYGASGACGGGDGGDGEYHQWYWSEDGEDGVNGINGEDGNVILQYVSLPPLADFIFSPFTPSVNQTIFFTDKSIDPNGYVINWTWDFGDGCILYIQNPVHHYQNSSLYEVELTVEDTDGDSNTVKKIVPVDTSLYSFVNLTSGWNFVSIPCNLSILLDDLIIKHNESLYTWSTACSELNPTTTPILNEYVFGWNRLGQYYVFTNSLEPGYGCWLYSYQDCQLLVEELPLNPDTYITNIETGWNMMGNPHLPNHDFILLLFKYQGVYYDWNEATTDDNPTNSPLINPYLFGWNPNQYYIFASEFEPGKAYWAYAYTQCEVHSTTWS